MTPILEVQDITKRFGPVVANDHVTFSVEQGEIHALIGENGAGKTTLMKILYGLLSPDDGEIFLRGKPVRFHSPIQAMHAGIGMVHQHFMLVPTLTVLENIVLGKEPVKGLKLDLGSASGEIRRISEEYSLSVDLDAKVEDISAGMQQRVEIIKVLYRGGDILIFDEPTAVLTPQETEGFFEIVRTLKEAGKTIIFITHKLKEVMALCDRITVMRKGRVIATVKKDETGTEELAEMMVGRRVILTLEKKPASPGPVVLDINNLYVQNDRGLPAVKGISLKVRAGEIVGIAGVEGNGQTELFEAIAGMRRPVRGNIRLNGRETTRLGPDQIRKAGVAFVPEDRHKHGLILDFSISENVLLGFEGDRKYHRGPFLDLASIDEMAKRLTSTFDVRASSISIPVSTLSGGNQQKIVLSRELSCDPCLLIISQPTRGVDVGAIEFIHRQILKMRDSGKAILLVSADLDEITSLADCIEVMYEGKIVAEFGSDQVDQNILGLYMTGARVDPEIRADAEAGA
ncbi:MAG: ABC transporter ATP-binding protein [Firmicutes bacterium]|nr:ABC transporter ATP-binding protein [Bacillota bacterium]